MQRSNHTPAEQTSHAALAIALMRDLRAVRQAYHVAVALLHARQRELDALRARYADLLDQLRLARSHSTHREAA